MRKFMVQRWDEGCFYLASIDKDKTIFNSVLCGFLESPVGKRHVFKLRTVESYDRGNQAERYSMFTGTANPVQGFRPSIRESSVVDDDDLLYSEIMELKGLLAVDPIQSFVSNISEAVLVLSKQEPHVILHCTKEMESILGVKHDDIFITALASFIAILEGDNTSALSSFLSTMRSRDSRGRSHTLLNLVHKQRGIVDSYRMCSLTSFPIYQSTTASPVGDSYYILPEGEGRGRMSRSLNENDINYFGVHVNCLRPAKDVTI